MGQRRDRPHGKRPSNGPRGAGGARAVDRAEPRRRPSGTRRQRHSDRFAHIARGAHPHGKPGGPLPFRLPGPPPRVAVPRWDRAEEGPRPPLLVLATTVWPRAMSPGHGPHSPPRAPPPPRRPPTPPPPPPP